MNQAIEILERHRLFLIEVEREADVQEAIKAIAIIVKQQADEITRLRKAIEEAPHEWHCRIRNDALINPQYEGAYCTCFKRVLYNDIPALETK